MKRSMTITKRPGAKRRKTTTKDKNVSARSLVARPPRPLVELKRNQALVENTITLGGAGVTFRLPLIQAGDLSSERNGRAIQVMGYDARCSFAAASTVPSCLVRIIIFLWKGEPDAPLINNILYDDSTSPPYQRSYNINHASNYKILSDSVQESKAQTGQLGGSAFYAVNQEYYRSSQDIKFTQTYSTNQASSVNNQALYCLAISSVDSTVFSMTAAVTFVDI